MSSDLSAIVSIINSRPDLHARWLNTFSFLEYIGFRKIVKSQVAETLDFMTLSHAVEEGRHALSLKKMAMKVGGEKFDTYSPESLLCGAEAETYFQSLDRACAFFLSGQPNGKILRLTYLYVTWLVERRALSVYSQYQAGLPQNQGPSPLGRFLVEEDRHLSAVEKELKDNDAYFDERVKKLQEVESGFYRAYLSALAAELTSCGEA